MNQSELIDKYPELANKIRRQLIEQDNALANRPDELSREIASELNQRVHPEELTTCPDCGSDISLDEPIESNGSGVAFGTVVCAENCGFKAREEWVHDGTVEVDQ